MEDFIHTVRAFYVLDMFTHVLLICIKYHLHGMGMGVDVS